MSKKSVFKLTASIALIVAGLSLISAVIAGPMGLPNNYKLILNKKWVFTKATQGKNDMTRMYVQNKLKGKTESYIFKNDGSVNTNSPGITNVKWKYENNSFKISFEEINPSGNIPATAIYTIGKVSAKTLQLDQKPAQISLIYTAK